MGVEHLILDLLRTRRGRIVVATLTTALGALFLHIAQPDADDLRRLKKSGATVDADVVETRISHGTHFDTSYDVRYRFRLAGSDRWFTREERGTSRTDLWSSLPKDQWERAKQDGLVRVVYVIDDPRINRPVANASESDALSILWVSWVVLIGGGCWLVLLIAGVLSPRTQSVGDRSASASVAA